MSRTRRNLLVAGMVGTLGWGLASSFRVSAPRGQPAPMLTPAAAMPRATPAKSERSTAPTTPSTVSSLQAALANSKSFEEADRVAAELAEMDSAESVRVLMEGIKQTRAWSERAALAKNLRALSNPETLAVLVPALLENYGRGSSIQGEIVDVIARLAQPETVEDLAALHWQASTQAGQGHKVLRAVAAIRNPAAKRGLLRLSERADSPALAAAAAAALASMRQPP